MKNTFTSANQFWTEFVGGTSLTSLAGQLGTASSCLSTWEATRMTYINDFAVANNFIRPHMINEILVALDKAFRRFPATTD